MFFGFVMLSTQEEKNMKYINASEILPKELLNQIKVDNTFLSAFFIHEQYGADIFTGQRDTGKRVHQRYYADS